MSVSRTFQPILCPKLAIQQFGLVLLNSCLIAISAQITLPLQPVPITLQSFSILLIAFVFGSRVAIWSVAAYLLEGALGLPVFAGGASGLAIFMSPSAGYIFGFLPAAFVAGKLMERGFCQSRIRIAASFFISNFFIYFPGVSVLSLFVGLKNGLALGVTPFLGIFTAKLFLLMAIVPYFWKRKA